MQINCRSFYHIFVFEFIVLSCMRAPSFFFLCVYKLYSHMRNQLSTWKWWVRRTMLKKYWIRSTFSNQIGKRKPSRKLETQTMPARHSFIISFEMHDNAGNIANWPIIFWSLLTFSPTTRSIFCHSVFFFICIQNVCHLDICSTDCMWESECTRFQGAKAFYFAYFIWLNLHFY